MSNENFTKELRLRNLISSFTVVAAVSLLSACGGGGEDSFFAADKEQTIDGGKDSSLVADKDKEQTIPPAVVKPGLYISELAANYRRTDGVSWVEVFNNSTEAIDLSHYRLRAKGWNVATQDISSVPMIFDLPEVSVPAGGYIAIAGKTVSFLTDTPSSVYISATSSTSDNGMNKTYAPYWTDTDGFVELLRASDNATADFVRFGTSTTAPLTASAWNGDNVAAFPAKPNYVTVVTPDPLDSHDGSIVRLSSNFQASGTKNDWSRVAFSTPGGPNDILTNAVDSDHDGIPDSAKMPGGTYGGMDLYSLGARKGQQDVFMHVSYMTKARDPATVPKIEALEKVANAFRERNIHIHFDAGNLFNASVDPASFNLSGNVSHEVPYAQCTQLLNEAALRKGNDYGFVPDVGCTSIYQYSSGSVDVRRKPIYRFMQLANSQLVNGRGGSSGIAELPGNKFLMTLGSWGFASNPLSQTILVNYQAGTIMHEFGHTLGLRHGGFENQNYKPNYFSTMNYMYQLNGLPFSASGKGPTQRYYHTLNQIFNFDVPGYAAGTYPLCAMPDGPCNTAMKIDYSNGSGKDLDEANLFEIDNIGRGSEDGAYFDWNLNGKFDPQSYPFDWINAHTVMKDHDDWSKLTLAPNPHDVTAQILAATAGVQFEARKQLHVGRKPGEIAAEELPSAHLIREIGNLK
ncbi:zinc metalloprotease [Collimonas silvisoli]|uniref:hypothetical protein n=1 Tax=Collimonas silvisoli TaxID=2825884 RepID=UPI001B8D5BF8|nr:hypothetical protein [Collimonas silvisoli]